MHVVTLSPFSVGTLLWRPDEATWTLTAIVKVTLALTPGDSVIAGAQSPVGGDRRYDDDPGASLEAAGDRAPFKKNVDVLVVGHAYSPREEPVVQLVTKVSES